MSRIAGASRPDKPMSFGVNSDTGTHEEIDGGLLFKVLQRDGINRTRSYLILPRLMGSTPESKTEEKEREGEVGARERRRKER